jgi:hypothetical protein
MPFAPIRDRSITLTLESELPSTNTAPTVLATNAAFTNRFLPQSGVGAFLAKNTPGLNKLVPKGVTLKGASYISVSHTADIATDQGLSTSFFQPWFVKPVAISVRGQSYLGAYPLVSPSDRDVERLLQKFRVMANDFSSLFGSRGTGERVLLELNGYPSGARKFLGYLKRLDWTEDIKQANLLDYTLEFVGRNVDNASLAKGKANQAQDVQAGGGA